MERNNAERTAGAAQNDTLAALLRSVSAKRALTLEQWLINHKECYPGAKAELDDQGFHHYGYCTCGESLDLMVVVAIVPTVVRKRPSGGE